MRIFSGVLLCLLDGHARRFAHGHQVIAGQHPRVHFLQILMHMRAVDAVWAVIAILLTGRHRPVRHVVRLGNRADLIHAEAVHALVAPPCHHAVHVVAQFRILPVQIGLLRREQVQIVHVCFRVKLPRRSAEARTPVVRRASVLFRFAPDVVVAIRVILALPTLHEPRMLVGRVVDNQVHHDANATPMRLLKQLIEIRHRAEFRLNRLIIADVIAVIDVRGLVHRRQPNHINAQLLQVVQPRRHALQIADAVAVCIHEAARIDLIDDGFLPPCVLHDRFSFFIADRPAGTVTEAVRRAAGRYNTISEFTCTICSRLFHSGVRSFHLA